MLRHIRGFGKPILIALGLFVFAHDASAITTSFTGTTTQSGRIFRDAIPSTCANKVYPGIFAAGTTFNFETFTYTNNGPATCVTFQFDPNSGPTPCGTNAHLSVYAGSYDPANQAANFLGDVGSSLTQPMSVTIPANTTAIVVVTNTGGAAACSFSVSPVDQDTLADLSVSMSDNPDPVAPGGALAYKVSVNNAGPNAALNAVATVTLPAGVTFNSTSGCSQDPTGVPTCTLGAIASGASKQFAVNTTVKQNAIGTLTAQVSVTSSPGIDPDPSNNSDGEASIVRSAQNDLLVDFGTRGLWQFLDNATWQKLQVANVLGVGAGDLDGSGKDEAVATFPGFGIAARYNNTNPFKKLQPGVARHFVVGNFDGNARHDIAADFGASGLWIFLNNSPGWIRVNTSSSQGLAVGDLDGNGRDELLVDFGARGLWARFNNSNWVKLHPSSPAQLATGDLDGNGKDEVIVDLGGDAGIFARFNNAGAFVKLLSKTSDGLATGDLDGNGKEELIADVSWGSGAGIWARFNNATWRKLHPGNANVVITADLDKNGKEEVVAGFGASGLFALFNNGINWRRLNAWQAETLAAGGFN